MKPGSAAATWIVCATLAGACAAPASDEAVADDELRAVSTLIETIDLALGAPFDRGEGLHNQAYAFDGVHHFSAGVTTAHAAWVFVHARDGKRICRSRVEDPFGPSSTGKVHPGGGVVVGGGLVSAVSNEVDGPGGAVALLRIEPPAAASRDAIEPACTTRWLPVDGRDGRSVVVGEYVGLVAEASLPGRPGTDLVVLNIHGARALRYDAAEGKLVPVGVDRPATSGVMPQQCARSGTTLVCTPLPLVGGLALQVVDGAVGEDGTLQRVGRHGFGRYQAPLGEGLSFFGGRLYIAGNAGLGETAGCGFAGLAMPCTTRDGTQRVYVYQPR